MGGRKAWRASEAYAARLLEEMGYRILGYHVPVTVDNVEISEVDLLVEKDGVRYAVEIKAGSLDVSGVRQAYVNAMLLGAKPMVVARGADDAARALASRLGVEVILLPDLLVAGFDDLREAVVEAVEYALYHFLGPLARCGEISDSDKRIIAVLASSETFSDAASKLGIDHASLGRIIADLRRRGILPQGPYSRLRLASMIIIACLSLSQGSSGER